MAENDFNIGPGKIAEAGTTDGPAFALSTAEWIKVQTYVTNALALPTTDAQFTASLGAGAPSDLSDFQQLIAAYKGMSDHCTTWKKTIFPNTVSLASDVVDYGRNKAPVYYPPILDQAKKLIANPDDKDAKDALKAILDVLHTQAAALADRARASKKEIQDFADLSSADQITLIGTDGQSGLLKYYNDKYGSTSSEVEDLNKEITAQRVILDAANAEYDHDVVVAATTPTYAWVFPFGTIAAAVVAGVYGDKAVKALDRVRAAQAKINELGDKLAADARLMTAIHLATNGIGNISIALAAALPVIQKIEGVWGGIADDLASLVTLIDTNIAAVPPIIMNLGVDSALTAWKNVADAADTYRVHAYVDQAPTTSLAVWRAAQQSDVAA